MADREYSSYQKKIISRFYDNRPAQDAQQLAELCTNLFLASGKKRAKFWETAHDTMTRLRVPPDRINHVVTSDDPEEDDAVAPPTSMPPDVGLSPCF